MAAMRIVVPRAALGRLVLGRQLVPGWLNAPQDAPQFVNLALIRQFLPLGQFHQLQNFV
jgi:hypothetical protein